MICDKGEVANKVFFKIPDRDGGEIKLIPPRDPNGLVAKGVVLLPAGAEPYGSQQRRRAARGNTCR